MCDQEKEVLVLFLSTLFDTQFVKKMYKYVPMFVIDMLFSHLWNQRFYPLETWNHIIP